MYSQMTGKSLEKIEKILGEPVTLGQLIWAIRHTDYECNQVEFAKKLGISKQQLCDIEHNRKSISPAMASEYAQKLNYSTDQFIRMALQGMLDRAGLDFLVDIEPRQRTA